MPSTPMDVDRSSATGPSLNIHRTLPSANTSSLNLSDVISSYRPTKLLKREDIKEGQAQPHVLSIDYDDEGELLMTSASDETIQIYNVREGRHDKSLLSKKYGVKLAKFTHTSSSIVYASTKQNHAIRYLATHDNSFIRYFEGHEADVTCLAVHPGTDNFISCSKDNTVRLWDTQTKHWQGQLMLKNPTLAAYDPSGTVFAVACPTSGTILLYDIRNYEKAPFATFDVVEQCGSIDPQIIMRGWTKLEFSNDGKSLLLGTRGSGHLLFDSFDGTFKAYLRKPAAGTRRQAPGEAMTMVNGNTAIDPSALESSGDCCFTPDGRFVVSGTKQDVLVWDTLSSASQGLILDPTWTLPDKREAAVVAFNPRFNFFATADQDLTRITTRFSIKPVKPFVPKRAKATTKTSDPDAETPHPSTRPPRGSLVLKTYDPVSGATLKYSTYQAAEVTRLFHISLGRLARAMAALPAVADVDEPMVDHPPPSTDAPTSSREMKAATTSSKQQQQTGGAGNKKRKGRK
ncbi:hypothetical protein CP532_1645 [Ophiocordyceps camponoti-leonardi (nom. inval.)]|nr:hypothetical protein CP532_1645 [Ophiocordyceps camponoti-leonardi (nom. inval.)]